ncbi:PERE peroxidase, partial [Alcedo cyanopectus]|nr:PERE peroxidase [Ceyx cyanopectus]
RITLLGSIITLCLAGTVESSLNETSSVLTDSCLLSSINEARQLVDTAYLRSRQRFKRRLKEKFASPVDFMTHLKDPVGRTRTAARAADYLETTLRLLTRKLRASGNETVNVTDVLDKNQTAMILKETGCSYQTRSIKCPKKDTYRTITGECNNRKRSYLGSSNHAFARWLPPEYEDGVSVPRGATEGKLYNGFPLPLVRKVSNEIAHTANENITLDQEVSLFFMQWGQWIAHDLDLSPFSGTGGSSDDQCETECAFDPPCFPIKFPPDDPRMPTRPCMPFTQSASVCSPRTFTREQINAVTSFLDASMVYGSDESVSRSIRNLTNQLGLMAVNQNFTDEGLDLLPFENSTNSVCVLTNETANIPCFKAGDKRVTENLWLSTLHTVFLREHNRLVTELRNLNPQWDGEKLFQETRKIIIAINEMLTYGEYLPILLGEQLSNWIPPYKGYKKKVDPRTLNVFSLAFRFGHTTVRPYVSRLNESFQPLEPFFLVPLHLTFCAPWRIILEGGIDPLLRGLLVDHAKMTKQDQQLVDELQNHLFEQISIIGLDLASLNMQRGRDHGLPGYNAWRGLCGLSQPQNQEELSEVLGNSELASMLMDLYGTPDNIDLWIGAVSEPLVPRGRVGPLLACIIGTQFRKLRDGDRFWWEKRGVFTQEQLGALRNVSLSSLICSNTRIKMVPRNVFRFNRYPEDFVDCQEINTLDLSAWKGE